MFGEWLQSSCHRHHQRHHLCQHGDGAGVQEDHQAAAGRVSLHVRICQLCAGCSLSKSIQSNPNSNTIGNSTTVLHPSKTALLFCQSNSAGLDPATGRQNSGEPWAVPSEENSFQQKTSKLSNILESAETQNSQVCNILNPNSSDNIKQVDLLFKCSSMSKKGFF